MFYSKKLKKFKSINHCFFSRKGGFSKGIYKGLNCGQGSKDSKKNIQRNLSLVSKKMKISKKKLNLMYQTHSNKVILINSYMKNLTGEELDEGIHYRDLITVFIRNGLLDLHDQDPEAWIEERIIARRKVTIEISKIVKFIEVA